MPDTQTDSVADELAIRRLLDEYCLRLELGRFEDWLDLFTPDAVYDVYKLTLTGHAQMAEVLGKAPHGVHIGGPARITINGDAAETLQNYLFIATSSDEWNAGWYSRAVIRTAAGWKIARCQVKFARKGALAEDARAKGLAFPINFG